MQSAFEALHAHTRQQTTDLARMLTEGLLTPEGFGDRMADLLEDAHTQAVVLGRMHAGDHTPVEEDDRRFAETVVDGEAEFLASFVADIQEGRYQDEDGAWKLDRMTRRAGLYADALLSTALEAWSLALPETVTYAWTLGGSHSGPCPQCEGIAADSPFTADTIPTWPPVHGNCRCSVTASNGQAGFSLS